MYFSCYPCHLAGRGADLLLPLGSGGSTGQLPGSPGVQGAEGAKGFSRQFPCNELKRSPSHILLWGTLFCGGKSGVDRIDMGVAEGMGGGVLPAPASACAQDHMQDPLGWNKH